MTLSHKESAALADLLMDAGAIGDALMVGQHDDARLWTLDLAQKAKTLGRADVAASAVQLAAHLGPFGSGPARGFGQELNLLSDVLDATPSS